MRAIDNTVGFNDAYFCDRLRDRLISNKEVEPDVPSFLHTFSATTLPPTLWGFAITLTQCHQEPLTVVRMRNAIPSENIRNALNVMQTHRRLPRFLLRDPRVCTMTIDFIPNPPTPVKPDFEHGFPGLIEARNGLRIVSGTDRLYVFPWQWLSLGLQYRETFSRRLTEHFAGRDPATLAAFAFESLAFQKMPSGWTNPVATRCSAEHDRALMTAVPILESDGQPDWERLRSLLAMQDASGWLGSQATAANWRINGLQVSDADFDYHCQVVIELVEYCSATQDMSILPQITAAMDCVFQYRDGSSNHPIEVAHKWPHEASTFTQAARIVRTYQAVTNDFQYADRLVQLRDRTCSNR